MFLLEHLEHFNILENAGHLSFNANVWYNMHKTIRFVIHLKCNQAIRLYELYCYCLSLNNEKYF